MDSIETSMSRACCSKFATDLNVRFTTISSLLNTWISFTKQKILLICSTGFKLNWFNSYDTNSKTITRMSFLQNRTKRETEILMFCVITFVPRKFQPCSAPQNDRQNFSFVKDAHVVCNKMARYGRKTTVYR